MWKKQIEIIALFVHKFICICNKKDETIYEVLKTWNYQHDTIFISYVQTSIPHVEKYWRKFKDSPSNLYSENFSTPNYL